ncbi:hydroxysqualene dehydroxylase HpnE [Fodinicola acaciae]|uniref:hydroxysqualene dehydroxylase HpnE n=1 Tax=Fodinicola acaciae TaxID=2681555 RepID=UPI0013CFDDAF|nr:hydroxysqualene dehydroxylase HpnE [Fodinicola acaciae]
MSRVAVVGGGLAGIAAALRCADAGLDVTLFESRGALGGLTHSFRRGDLSVDNGQHVFLRCCTAYIGLLERLGVRDKVHLQDRLAIPVRSARTGPEHWLRRGRLAAPYHLSESVLAYRHVSMRERIAFAQAALALRDIDPVAVDDRSFGDWLRERRQSARTVETLWDLIGVATLNSCADNASLSLAATVFQVGLLSDASASDLGWSKVPLSELHGEAARSALSNVDLRLNAKVRSLSTGWRVDGESFDQVVLAVPPPVAERLLPAGAVNLTAGWSERLGNSPIINVHVHYDRQVLDQPFVAAIDSPLQWVFDRTTQAGVSNGQYVAVSLSAADDLVGLPTGQLRARMLPALAALLPSARGARILDFFVTRERTATFRPAPGTAALRPAATTAATGLFLAGAWTATGWPATMEGAVRSGDAAAAALLSQRKPIKEAAA